MKLIKYIFPTLSYMLFNLSTSAQKGDSLQMQLARKWNNAKVYTLQLAAQMPEEAFEYKPTPEVMSFKEQLLHIAGNMQWLSSSFLFVEKETIKFDTTGLGKEAMLQYISAAYDKAHHAHYNLTEKQLNEVVSFFAGPMTRRQILV